MAKGGNAELVYALEQLAEEKGLSPEVLFSTIEAALVSAYRRNSGTSQNVRVQINPQSGEIHVFAQREVVEQVEDPKMQIGLEEARQVDPAYQVGDIFETEVTPRDFGRIAAQTAKQVVVQRLREAERGLIFEEFQSREGDIVTGLIHRIEGHNLIIDLGKVEGIISPQEQIPGELYRQGDRIKVLVVEVRRTPKGPLVILSRTHPGLLRRLFELEVPEVHDGVVEIKGAAREPGVRSKIAVWSRDPNVDPIGACIGPRGARVQSVVAELRGERVDIIKWDPDPAGFVANALQPAKVIRVDADEASKVARAVVPDFQLSLAIGKEGQNARLAARLTGWKIDIRSESQARLGEVPVADTWEHEE